MNPFCVLQWCSPFKSILVQSRAQQRSYRDIRAMYRIRNIISSNRRHLSLLGTGPSVSSTSRHPLNSAHTTRAFTSTIPVRARESWTTESLSIPSANVYPVSATSPKEITHVAGEPFALFLDLSRVSVGDHFVVPHEFTVTGKFIICCSVTSVGCQRSDRVSSLNNTHERYFRRRPHPLSVPEL